MKKELLIDILFVSLGNIILAIGVSFFILPNSILGGGVAGVAVALEPLFDFEPELVINFLTYSLFIVGAIILGKKFAIKSLFSTITFPLLVSLFGYLIQLGNFEEFFIIDKYLASIFGGALMGIGIGLVFRSGGSTGGLDIPPLIINKYTHIQLSTLVMAVDAVTITLGVAVVGLEAALIGILSVWVSSYTINKTMLLGGVKAKNVMIITDKNAEVIDAVHENLDRGCTLLAATGGFTNEKKEVIMTIIFAKQVPQLQHLVSIIDPKAFVIVNDVNEVQGEGFSYEQAM